MRLEVLAQKAEQPTPKPPLLFVHGSYHAAWCWAERFMPHFAAAGHDCYAISLRAQGNSDRSDLKVGGTFASHAADVASFAATLARPPVLVAHSFGGAVALQYAQGLEDGSSPALAGMALLCSVPPSGNKALVGRIFQSMPLVALKITWGFITKSFARSQEACREMFFSDSLPLDDLQRYQAQLARCSPVPLVDVRNVSSQFPLAAPPPSCPQVFVGGCTDDVVVDVAAVEETAAACGVAPVVIDGMAHDCMLDTRWREMADALEVYLEGLKTTP